MQTQDAPAEFLFKLWPWLEANKSRLIAGAATILVVLGIYFFISSQREQKETNAGMALTQLLVSPPEHLTADQVAGGFAQLADKYPGTVAGQRAQLQAAAAFFNAGRYGDTQAQFQKFLDAGSTGPLAAIAQLGVAASLDAQTKLDAAAAAYLKVTTSFPGSPSAVPAEFALGRIAEQQGHLNEALNYYGDAAHASLGGSLAQMAAQRVFEIRSKLAAAQTSPTQILK